MTKPFNPSGLAREKMAGGVQTFAKAKEAMARSHVMVRDEAEALPGAASDESGKARREQLDVEASDRLQTVQDEPEIERGVSEGGR